MPPSTSGNQPAPHSAKGLPIPVDLSIGVQGLIRGHVVDWDQGIEAWRYHDTYARVLDPPRTCAHCGITPNASGHDPCLGEIPGAIGACCGHGVYNGYIAWPHAPLPPDARWWNAAYITKGWIGWQ